MALPNLYGEAAGLLRGTGDIVLGSRKLDEAAADRSADVAKAGLNAASGLAERSIAEKGANARQDQQLAAQMIEITPQLAKGAQNATGDDSWGEMVGKKMRADVYSGLLVHGQRQDLSANWKPIEITEGGKTRTALFNEKTSETIELGTPGTGKRRGTSGSTALPGKDKEFVKTFRQYQKDTENWNYELLKGLSTTDEKQASDLKSKLDFIEENKDRFDDLQGIQEKPAAGGKGKGGNPDQAAVDWLIKKHPEIKSPTAEDIAWAKRKMNG